MRGVLRGQEVHWHVHLVGGGRAKAPQVYPKELAGAILRGFVRRELWESGEELYKKELGQFVDDVTGTELPAHLVRMARKEELDWRGRVRKSPEEDLCGEGHEALAVEVAGDQQGGRCREG